MLTLLRMIIEPKFNTTKKLNLDLMDIRKKYFQWI